MMEEELHLACFAGVNFWDLEAALQQLTGVINTATGYTGGHTENPTYSDVSAGDTGHLEAVIIEYDPSIITYKELIETFFACINPKETEYTPIIYYFSEEQKKEAELISGHIAFNESDINTKVMPAEKFWRAEEENQSYYQKISSRYGGTQYYE